MNYEQRTDNIILKGPENDHKYVWIISMIKCYFLKFSPRIIHLTIIKWSSGDYKINGMIIYLLITLFVSLMFMIGILKISKSATQNSWKYFLKLYN